VNHEHEWKDILDVGAWTEQECRVCGETRRFVKTDQVEISRLSTGELELLADRLRKKIATSAYELEISEEQGQRVMRAKIPPDVAGEAEELKRVTHELSERGRREEARRRIPAPPSATWECGCGAVNGVNLANCGLCEHKRSETDVALLRVRNAIAEGKITLHHHPKPGDFDLVLSRVDGPEYFAPDPGDPQQCSDEKQGHRYLLVREDDELVYQKCAACNAKRWRYQLTPEAANDAKPIPAWSYGEPPAPVVRVLTEEEEDDFVEDPDGNVPQEISTPQPRTPRLVGGRMVYPDAS